MTSIIQKIRTYINSNKMLSVSFLILSIACVSNAVIASTTISTDITTGGSISSNATSTAPAFVATSTTATSSFAGNVSIGGNLSVSGITNSFLATNGSGQVIATTTPTSGSSGPKVYRALLSQTGTDAPVATVLENSLGGTIVWSRYGVGSYNGSLANSFTLGKTFISLTQDGNSSNASLLYIGSINSSTIEFDSRMLDLQQIDLGPGYTAVEILVYP